MRATSGIRTFHETVISPVLAAPLDLRPLFIVVLLVAASAGAALAVVGIIIGIAWATDRGRGQALGTQDVSALADEDDPLALAVHAAEVGAAPTAERRLRALLQTSDASTPAETARIQLALAYVLGWQAHYDEAATHYAAALRVAPDLMTTCVDLAANLAYANRDQAAEIALVALLAVPVSLAPDSEPRSLAHHLYGQILRRMNRLEEAERQLRTAVTLRPTDPAVRNNFGAVFEALGRAAEALTQYTEGVRLAPENGILHGNLGGLLLRMGRLEEARTHLVEATALAPERPTAHMNLAALQLKYSHWHEAEREARAALALRPNAVEAHLSLATALLQLDQVPEAEEHARRAVELAPTRAEGLLVLGQILRARGNEGEAQQRLRQALQANPFLPEILRGEADRLAALGLMASAQAQRQEAGVLEQAARQP